MDDVKLLGLQRAEFQRAETFSARSNNAQFFIVLISVASVFVSEPKLVYAVTVLSLLVAILWLYLSHQSKASHSTAERARRAVVLRNGLGIRLSRKSYSDLMMQFNVNESEGGKWEDATYFKSAGEYGNKKLTEIVEESSFWSKHLFRLSATRQWIYFGVTLCISIIGLLVIPLLSSGELNLLISHVICLILLWLITGSLFSTAMAFTRTANAIDAIEGRLSNMANNIEPDEDVLLLVGDYNEQG